MKIRIEHNVSKGFIVAMISLYTYIGTAKLSKKDFVAFMRDQISMFGSDYESQFGTNHTITELSHELYEKWFSKQ